MRERAASNEIRSREVGQTIIQVEKRRQSKEVVSNSCNEIETQEVIEIVSAIESGIVKSHRAASSDLFGFVFESFLLLWSKHY